MAKRATEISLALTSMILLIAGHASAQSSSFTTVIMSLAPCLGYITGNNASAPSSSCCAQLDGVVESHARCLCTLLNGSSAPFFGININRTQLATALPGACKVRTPPVSRCNAAAPTESPPVTRKAPAIPSTPSVPKVPSGKGSITAPTGESSGRSTYKSTRSMMISALFLVLFISYFAF